MDEFAAHRLGPGVELVRAVEGDDGGGAGLFEEDVLGHWGVSFGSLGLLDSHLTISECDPSNINIYSA
ncbi:hypothetical protein AAU01_02070 [Paenarthrobacter aurescens]|uniref:Uncharacterized protein n=1 Tax=Paenarthrobacter aurescens TaxID=43663 RepID=A0A4Y3N7D2_PAEAU|nr:hypothetical protein AAU01_02070 [Paenarthrobacter aurescens]